MTVVSPPRQKWVTTNSPNPDFNPNPNLNPNQNPNFNPNTNPKFNCNPKLTLTPTLTLLWLEVEFQEPSTRPYRTPNPKYLQT